MDADERKTAWLWTTDFLSGATRFAIESGEVETAGHRANLAAHFAFYCNPDLREFAEAKEQP